MIQPVTSPASASSSPVEAFAAPAAKVAAPAVAEPVTVQISVAAQVKQLDSSGSSLAEISVKTGLDLATIKQYLGQ